MTVFYVGRCPECGTARAGAIRRYADDEDVRDMVDSGLMVYIEDLDDLTVHTCEHSNEKRWIRVR